MDTITQDRLALLRAVRKNIKGIFAAHSLEQVNTIPAGFNNNMAWNAGHVIATMELLVYGLSGVKTPSGRKFIDRYRKGTKPEGDIDQAEYDLMLEKLNAGVDQLEADLEQLDFSQFKEYATSFGVTLKSAAEALAFNNMHESMHLGTMLALRGVLRG